MCFSAYAFACIKFHAMALEQVVSQGVGVRSASWSQGWGFGCFGVGGSRGGGGLRPHASWLGGLASGCD